MDRVARLLEGVDIETETGLEIGPLSSPLVERVEGRPIYYADYAGRDHLVAASANNPNVDPARIPEIDYIVAPLPPRLDRTFDYIVASHVAEHVPDLLGWIATLCSWLNEPNGRLILAIPDKRHTFDLLRPLSTTGQVLEAYYERRHTPEFAAVYDGFSTAMTVDTVRTWHQYPYRGPLDPLFPPSLSLALARTAKDTHHDCHCWVFTFESFIKIFDEINNLGVESLNLKNAAAPVHESNEFHVTIAPRWGTTPPHQRP